MRTKSSHPAISLRDVTVRFDQGGESRAIVSALNIDLTTGALTLVAGRSGSGKSTVLSVLGLLLRPDEGSVLLEGQAVPDIDEDARASLRAGKFGYIFQSYELLPHLSLLDNVLLPASYVGGTTPSLEARARTLLAQVGLGGREASRPLQLSGGEQQRVAIARALLLDPQIILADEPTGALDQENTVAIMKLLRGLADAGRCVVIISHAEDAAIYADRVVRIDDGRIVSDAAHAAPSEIQGLMDSPSVSALEKETPAATGIIGRLAPHLRLVGKRGWRTFAATGLGLIVGVAAILIASALGGELRRNYTRFFEAEGGRSVFIVVDKERVKAERLPAWRGFHVESDLPSLQAMVAGRASLDPLFDTRQCVISSDKHVSGSLLTGIGRAEVFAERHMPLAKGRFPSPAELAGGSGARVAVLGQDALSKLFPRSDARYETDPQFPIGQLITAEHCGFGAALKVIGVLGEMEAVVWEDANKRIYVPTPGLLAGGMPPFVTGFNAVAHQGVDSMQLAEELKDRLSAAAGHAVPFRFNAPERMMKRFFLITRLLQAVIYALAALCVLMGGASVMNTMLANVSERVREIGLRKALGASRRAIRRQLRSETMIYCGVATLGGVIVGWLLANPLAALISFGFGNGFALSWRPFAAEATLAAVVGMVAGYVFGGAPARHAESLDVVRALQDE